jgi:hypothetical protein
MKMMANERKISDSPHVPLQICITIDSFQNHPVPIAGIEPGSLR